MNCTKCPKGAACCLCSKTDLSTQQLSLQSVTGSPCDCESGVTVSDITPLPGFIQNDYQAMPLEPDAAVVECHTKAACLGGRNIDGVPSPCNQGFSGRRCTQPDCDAG